MRGNLQTRMQKLKDGACDALLLAYAGVNRMGYEEHISELIDLDTFTPAVGQGSVAIECAKNLASDKKARIKALCNNINTEKELLAERAFLRKLQGGCSIPVFALSRYEPKTNQQSITGGIVSLNGQTILKEIITGNSPETIGLALAEKNIKPWR